MKNILTLVILSIKILCSREIFEAISNPTNDMTSIKSTCNQESKSMDYELIDTIGFKWNEVINFYFDNKEPSVEELKIFKEKIYSPLFRILYIIHSIFNYEGIAYKKTICNCIDDTSFQKLIITLMKQKKNMEYQFSQLIKFMDSCLTEEYIKSEYTNTYFVDTLLKIFAMADERLACKCSVKKTPFINFQDLFCIKYKIIDNDSKIESETIFEYCKMNSFDFIDGKIMINPNRQKCSDKLLNIDHKNQNTIKIEHYPQYIILNSSKKNEMLQKNLFNTEPIILKFFCEKYNFFEKEYIVIGFLEEKNIQNEFCYREICKAIKLGSLPKINNSFFKQLKFSENSKCSDMSENDNVLFILKRIDTRFA